MKSDVVVLGAGPAGLAAAWELALAGARVTVLEARSQVGGLAATEQRDGYRFDYGGHRFMTRWPALLERVRKLMGDDLLLVDRRSVVLSQGRRVGYPLELVDLLRTMPWWRGGRYVASYLHERVRRPPRDEASFEGWMTRRFGPALYGEFFAPYTRKLWGLDPKTLSSEWAPQRIGRFDLGLALRRLLRLTADEPRTYARRFLYPRLGMGQLFAAIAAEVERLGGKVVLGARVDALECEGRQVRAVRTGAGAVEASHFISSLPLPDLLSFVGVDAGLRFRGLRFLNVELDGPAELGATWAYLSDGDGLVSRIQEPARRSPFMTPPGRGSLQLEVPASPGEWAWECSDQALIDAVWREVRGAGVEPAAPIRGFFSTRSRVAYPITSLAARGHTARALARADDFANLQAIGRQGRFSYVFADRAMEEGILAARRWLGLPGGPPALGEAGDESCLTETHSLLA